MFDRHDEYEFEEDYEFEDENKDKKKDTEAGIIGFYAKKLKYNNYDEQRQINQIAEEIYNASEFEKEDLINEILVQLVKYTHKVLESSISNDINLLEDATEEILVILCDVLKNGNWHNKADGENSFTAYARVIIKRNAIKIKNKYYGDKYTGKYEDDRDESSKRALSLDKPSEGDSDNTLLDKGKKDYMNPEDQLKYDVLVEDIILCLKELDCTPEEIQAYFDKHIDNIPIAQLAKQFNVTRQGYGKSFNKKNEYVREKLRKLHYWDEQL